MSGAGLVSGSWEGSEEGASGDGEADGSGLKAGDSLTAGESLAGGWLPVGEGLMAGVEDAAPGARGVPSAFRPYWAASAGLTSRMRSRTLYLLVDSRVELTRLPSAS